MNCTTGFHDDYDDDDYWRQTRKFFWGGITKWIDLKSKVVYLKILGGLVVIKSPLIFWQPLRLRNEDEAKCLTGRTGKAGLRSRQVKSEISSSHWNVCGARLIRCTVEEDRWGDQGPIALYLRKVQGTYLLFYAILRSLHHWQVVGPGLEDVQGQGVVFLSVSLILLSEVV